VLTSKFIYAVNNTVRIVNLKLDGFVALITPQTNFILATLPVVMELLSMVKNVMLLILMAVPPLVWSLKDGFVLLLI
jgi:hypothetical protein